MVLLGLCFQFSSFSCLKTSPLFGLILPSGGFTSSEGVHLPDVVIILSSSIMAPSEVKHTDNTSEANDQNGGFDTTRKPDPARLSPKFLALHRPYAPLGQTQGQDYGVADATPTTGQNAGP